ncbi:MAG: glycosyltransferase family 2 protein [Ktedonobacteraceae bacterium]
MRAKNSRGTCDVSVVVPTYRRPDLLRRCLRALIAQDYAATAYEVIIVDDAACDETRQMVECYAELVSECGNTLRYIAVTGNHGPAIARNIGWRAASSDIIAFTDDDCIPAPNWLMVGVKAFHQTGKDITGVSGRIIVPLAGIPTDYERNAAHLETSEFVTANCFYRRSCLTAVGGFDERFTAAWREDSDLFFALLQRNATLVYEPDAIVVHPLRPAQWGVSLSQQRKSMFNALLYKKHPSLYRQKIQATPPWHYYLILAALLTIVGGTTGKFPRLTFFAACLWLLLTGRFCLHRLHHTSSTRSHRAEMLYTSILIPPIAIYWRLRGVLKFRVFFL